MAHLVSALALGFFFISATQAQWRGYVYQSFSLVRSDTLQEAPFEMLANVSLARDNEVLNYEERLYPAAKWACTARTVPRIEGSPARGMFVDLFRYFAGDNVDKKDIELTIPINTYVQPRDNDVTYYETCLVLPAKARSNPPQPNNPAVFLEDKPEMVILTRRVSGYFITDTAWEGEAIALKKVLKEKELEADFSGHFRNLYDAPVRLFNRRNEVWFRKTGPSARRAIDDYRRRMDAKHFEIPVLTVDEELLKKMVHKPADEPVVKKPDEKKKSDDKKKAEPSKVVNNKPKPKTKPKA